MFGLTKREQRWKAEQQAAGVLAGLAAVVLRGEADARVAEAHTDAAELARLRAENAGLRRLLVDADEIFMLRSALLVAQGALVQCSPCVSPECQADQREWLDDAIAGCERALNA